MRRLGAHVSTAGGLHTACERAHEIGATAFALFTKNPRRLFQKPLQKHEIEAFDAARARYGFSPAHIVPHEGYLVNLGNPDEEKRHTSCRAFTEELQRCARLSLTLLNIHPGNRLEEKSEERCMEHIAACINTAIATVEGPTVALEITAGQGSSVGYRFEHLRYMIDLIEDKNRIGICYDTCHAFAAGYDIRTRTAFEHTMQQLDDHIGFSRLKAVHLNDSRGELGRRLDRHEPLGMGHIGWDGFAHFMRDPRFDEIPLILETPDHDAWPREIAHLSSLQEE